MSEEAERLLNEARDKMLREQTRCAWCEARFADADRLVLHIWETHDPPENPGFIHQLKEQIKEKNNAQT